MKCSRNCLVAACFWVWVATSVAAQTVFVESGEFQVNQPTSGCVVSAPSVAANGDGALVVTWGSSLTDWEVYARRYASDGSPIGGPFAVNTYTTGVQTNPAVAMNDLGEFVIVYESNYAPTSSFDIRAQRYAADGSTVGSEMVIESVTSAFRVTSPAVTMSPSGDFVVAWGSEGSAGLDSDGYSVQARSFLSSGLAMGQQFQVNDYTTGSQSRPHLAMGPLSTDFVVVWESGSDTKIQRLAFDGTPLEIELVLAFSSSSPDVAFDQSGAFQVVWSGLGVGDDGLGILRAPFNSDGSSGGDLFLVNSYTTGEQREARIAVENEGEAVVTWFNDGASPGTDTSQRSVQAHFVSPVETETQVNTYTTGFQHQASAAVDDRGNVTVVWTSSTQVGGTCAGIIGQRYSKAVDLGGIPSLFAGTINGTSILRSWKYFYLDVGTGLTEFQVRLTDLPVSFPQDADLYVRFGAKPDASNFDCRSARGGGADEACGVSSASAGRWWIGVANWNSGPIDFTLEVLPAGIFSDGFESGNLSAWSAATP